MEMLRVEDLGFIYPPNKEALTGLSLSIEESDVVIISGPNGCGKTTLLKCLNGLLKATRGKVFFKGTDTSLMKKNELFSQVGYLFQDPNDQLFAATVWQDIAFGPRNMGLSDDEVAVRVEETIELLDIRAIQDKPVHDLSHGSKQRVALAGVLAMRPKVLLLDEPTASLDPQTEDDIISFLKDINRKQGMTIIMATHQMDVISEFAHRIVVLDNGNLAGYGTLDEIFSCDGCLKRGRLKLPLITELLKNLKDEGLLSYDKLPLTQEQASQVIRGAIGSK